jgi:hypothetical protein
MFSKEEKNIYEDGLLEVLRAAKWSFKKIFFSVIALIIIVYLSLAGLGLLSQPIKVLEKTFSADNMIYNYEWFHNKSNDIYAAEKAITITKSTIENLELKYREVDLIDYPRSINVQFDRLSTNLNGQQIYFEQLLADFRARSEMVNRSIFKGDSKIIRWVNYKL